MMETFFKLLLVMLFLGAVGCSKSKKHVPEPTPQKPATFKEAMVSDVTPILGGGAYASGYSDGIWFLYRDQVTKVKVGSKATPNEQKAFEEGISEVIPLSSGGAYAFTFSGDSFWFLEGAVAFPVNQVESITLPTKIGDVDSLGMVLYQKERRKRKEAQSEAEELQSQVPSDQSDDQSDY